ncbi:hypothetical protein [Salipiger mangrovisoli]|uniref:Uncharacterized protein n=1 Tax=Salipiger mangrovisoli TaxID=2865933 RepID=A0ABR9WX97_9RHOB|nr:hypothetical protein [Salipiger mangrovisoli]MBE9635882.1 hypothetical protein [Salipiger mangrovisoli]
MRHTTSRRVLIAILSLALAAATLVGVRTVRHALYWADPAHRNVAPEGWMTLGYLERSHHLTHRSLGPALGLTPQPGDPLSLEEIADRRGEPLAQLLTEVADVIAAQKR